MSRRGGSRPHSGHRKHRRRWTGPYRPIAGEVAVATLPPVDGCRPGIPCNWHGQCSSCGETIHLAGGVVSEHFGPYTVDRLAAMVVGTPPRCRDCRGLA